MSFAPWRLMSGTIASSSSLSPEFESAMKTSSRATMPRSPWLASAGWTKYAGVPVLARVDAILRAMCPDFPMPLTTTRPRQFRIVSTAWAKRPSSLPIRSATALASISSTSRAMASAASSREARPALLDAVFIAGKV
jgi:hypothetical protein